MAHSTTIYVSLINEGTNVWRPVEAFAEGDGVFRITSSEERDEEWQFPSGSRVVCVEKKLSDGQALVAMKLAP